MSSYLQETHPSSHQGNNVLQPIEPMQLDASIDEADVYETSDSSSSDNFNQQMVDSTPFEVETYASQYTGYGKLIRLMYIADHCPPLQIDALEQAMKYVRDHTFNVQMYMKIQNKLSTAFQMLDDGSMTQHSIDNSWVEKQNALSQIVFEKLETDLKNYKTNSIKESIRRGHDDLGAHYLSCGDLNNALKCYTRSRDYCVGDHHLFSICLNVIKLNIYLQNWSHVSSYIHKAESAEFSSSSAFKSKINCIAGLHDLVTKQYKASAERFVLARFDDLGQQFTDIMSPNNIAIYGGLCALATFDRDELRKKVLQSSNFRLFLELEPQLREAINRFLESKYPDCLKLLDELKDAFLLDLYLAPHVKTLYSLIRSRALIQYFTPYLSADLQLMASAFNTTVVSLEEELMRLILDGQIQARIDSHNKILYAKDTDPRLLAFEVVLKKGSDWQMKARTLMLRAACIRNGMITIRQTQPQLQQQQPQSSQSPQQQSSSSTSNNRNGTNDSSMNFPSEQDSKPSLSSAVTMNNEQSDTRIYQNPSSPAASTAAQLQQSQQQQRQKSPSPSPYAS